MNHNQELTHFGVKGMRWGVRKSSSKSSSSRAKSKEAAREERHANKIKKLDSNLKASNKKVKELEKEIMDLPLGAKNVMKRLMLQEYKDYEQASADYYKEALSATKKRQLTQNQKFLIDGAFTMATSLLIR